MMRKTLIFAALFFTTAVAYAQTSNTNCYGYGSSVQCTTTSTPGIDWNAWSQRQQQIQQQQQQNTNQAFANLGAAIAARSERKRQEKAARAAAAAAAITAAAVKAAIDADRAPAMTPPSDEQPVLLACTIGGSPVSLALYENHGRVDTTSAGVTRTRQAVFTTAAITWTAPLIRSTLSRLDGSYLGYGNIPEVEGQTVTGSCKLAESREF